MAGHCIPYAAALLRAAHATAFYCYSTPYDAEMRKGRLASAGQAMMAGELLDHLPVGTRRLLLSAVLLAESNDWPSSAWSGLVPPEQP